MSGRTLTDVLWDVDTTRETFEAINAAFCETCGTSTVCRAIENDIPAACWWCDWDAEAVLAALQAERRANQEASDRDGDKGDKS